MLLTSKLRHLNNSACCRDQRNLEGGGFVLCLIFRWKELVNASCRLTGIDEGNIICHEGLPGGMEKWKEAIVNLPGARLLSFWFYTTETEQAMAVKYRLFKMRNGEWEMLYETDICSNLGIQFLIISLSFVKRCCNVLRWVFALLRLFNKGRRVPCLQNNGHHRVETSRVLNKKALGAMADSLIEQLQLSCAVRAFPVPMRELIVKKDSEPRGTSLMVTVRHQLK